MRCSVAYWDHDSSRIRRVLAILGRIFIVKFSDTLGDLRRDAMDRSFSAIIMGLPREDDSLAIQTAGLIAESAVCGFYFIAGKNLDESIPSRYFPDRGIPVLELDQLQSLEDMLSSRSTPLHEKSESAIFTGTSGAIRKAEKEVRKYAVLKNPVLVLGETGSGKELAARALHELSGRSRKDFVALNCSAIPDSLVESELFGTEKGAFTDAVRHPGAFGRASGGTLFLDEIGSMPAYAQPRLLRVLESGEYARLGGNRVEKSDFRLVSATCENLSELVARTIFRADLFYRVSDLVIRIPPLRERLEDLEDLALFFCREAGSSSCELSQAAIDRLADHDWPGNVRELRSVINRACVTVGEGIIGPEHIDFLEIPRL